ncbi:gamma-glutamyltransferase family protein [Alkalilacustris brevis]|uniref:gamma-glutamyltransferase family protein n=1 Tax=Alkalilacustris brevis TaxID=2026338 RepID=UPI000E0D88C7|nr:gamma-glutamyltransferase family protein [Alkalilacustris brevis]
MSARFTTRPEIKGYFGVVTSTHWIATAVGMRMLELGGNAFDAAVATGMVLQVVEPHLNGPAGDMPAILHSARTGKTEVLCAQGPAPAGATIEEYTAQGLKVIPGDGLLATVIPGAFDGWMLMLRDHGRLSLRQVMEPAIWYAEKGHPVLPAVAATIQRLGDFFRENWPTSYETWHPGGRAPQANENVCNPVLAQTWQRILKEAEAREGREAQIDAARDAFYRGFVAETIGNWLEKTELPDHNGHMHRPVLTAQDMAGYSAHYEAPQTYDYHDWTICKTGPWGQGPVLLQALALLKGFDIGAMDPRGVDFVHTVTEAKKLAYADREVYYGDPEFSKVPMDVLLSDAYNDERRKLIGDTASLELRPGTVPGFEDQRARTMAVLDELSPNKTVYEPTMEHLADRKGDTVHIDVIDAEGNMVSITPSGGWLQSSPTIPGLGFCLNSRAQMFWLREGLPTSLAPGKRPRTTLTPALGLHKGRPAMAFGTPGGDQQDQWQLSFLLRIIHHGMNLQEAIDTPLFHSMHFPASFYPRGRRPGQMLLEESFGPEVIEGLRARGHGVDVSDPWTIGRLTAALREPDGLLRAAATPRLMQAYAIGR